MFGVFDAEGRLVAKTSQDNPLYYNPTTEKLYRVEPKIVDGVMTDEWEETTLEADPPNKFFNPIDKKLYVLAPITVDGVVTDRWVEVT